MKRGGWTKLVRAYLAILAWIGGVGSSPVIGHSHGSSPVPHSHASSGFIAHDHSSTDFEAGHDDHDDGPLLEESFFHLHTSWMGMPFSLPAPDNAGQDGKFDSIQGKDSCLLDGGVASQHDTARGAPLDAPGSWPWDDLPLPPALLRSSPSHARDGLRPPDASCLRSVNLRC